MQNIVIASCNSNKIKEFAGIFARAGLPVGLSSMADFGLLQADESAETFVGNALIKADQVTKSTNKPALADDSGLVVPALGGAPGILSARYAGDKATDKQNRKLLLLNLRGIKQRQAFFYCAIAFFRYAQDPAPLIACGCWQGEIAEKATGDDGFGYDSIFYIPTLGKTAAQLKPQQKNLLSHRAIACNKLLEALKSEIT